MEPNRTEWQKRCTFNGFCKKVLKNEAIDAIRESRTRSRREVVFSELTPHEENQLYTRDKYFAEEEQGSQVAGKRITAKLLADAAIWDWYHRAKTAAKPPARQGG